MWPEQRVPERGRGQRWRRGGSWDQILRTFEDGGFTLNEIRVFLRV